MSALELLREVMSAPHDPVHYDTDTVSVTSTVEDAEEQIFFHSECIIAERDEETCYLVKWEDYPLDECTWEPPEHLDSTNLIARWEQAKQELGRAFQRENENNIEAYEKAQARADDAKALKYRKREKKRKKLQRRDRRVVYEADSSEAEPLATARQRSSLFVAEDNRPASGLPAETFADARPPPTPRRVPLQQSSSEEESSSEVQNLEDSLLNEMQRRKKLKKKADAREAREGLGTSILQEKKKKLKSTASETAPRKTTVPERGPQRLDVSATTAQSAFPTASGQDRTLVKTTTTQKPTDSAVSRTGGTAIRTAPPKQTHRAINFVDQPKEPQRKEWDTDNHYNKLKFRALADKRSRAEGTPDFNALNFVNGPPPSLPKAALKPASDPYGRRDITNRRVQEDDPDDRPRLGPNVGPLVDWEKDKVPQICNAWKLSSNCPYGAQKCRFMHRTHDAEGRPYQLGDIHNRIPAKYRKPPITCEYWYDGNRCKKTAEECAYAHEDTGFTEINGKAIEREHMPPNSAGLTPRIAPTNLVPFKLQDPPITCHYWLRDLQGCTKSEATCKYAHWNTGWAPPEYDIRELPVSIDPGLQPRGVVPKYASPAVTCPFWLRSETGCTRTDEECRYAHWNTGCAPPGLSNGQPLSIDSQLQPRSQSRLNTERDQIPENRPMPSGPRNRNNKDLTCPAWLRDPRGCAKSDDVCYYSHSNTGWATPKNKPSDSPVPLDPNQIPRLHRDRMAERLAPKYRNPPITCPSWLRHEHGCHETEFECIFAHKNTGWIPGNGDGTVVASPVQIDRNEMPRSEAVRFTVDYSAPKNGNPPITCYFWLEGLRGCVKSAANCKFAHRNTGWIVHLGPGQNPNPEQIDPKKAPRFRKLDPTEDSSVQSVHVASSLRRESLKFTSEPGIDLPDYSLANISREQVQSPVAFHDALPAINTSQLNTKIQQFYNLNITEMFLSGVPGDNTPLEPRAMLLYSPEENSEDIDLITRWLLMHDVQVSNLWYDGAWTQFQKDVSEGKSGIIMAHPDFERYVELPGFGEVLKHRTPVWSVGLQPPPEYEFGVSPNPPELRYDRVNLFPHGGFIYITDDVFEQKPQLALNIVKLFFAKIEQLRSLDGPASPWLEVFDACLLWRLCVRPELMESLYQKCAENPAELAAQNPDYLSRVELYQLLTSTNYIEQDHPSGALSLVQDKYPILSERRVVAEHPPLDYFNRLAYSQENANTHMVGYYAAMQSADMQRAYRYFYVVHTEPEAACAKEWKASIHNIADIITPEQCMEELRQPSKESLFDFLDWAMEPKEEQSEVEPEAEEMGDAPMEMSSPMKEISTGPIAH